MTNGKIEVTVYPNRIPDFIEASLESLYENIFSSLPFLKSFNTNPAPISTYVVSKDGIPHVVLLFQIQEKCIKVLNEAMHISATEIERFASTAFSRFAGVNMISFNAIRTDFGRIAYPSQRYNCLEDIVVTLPRTQQEYTAELSKTTRKTIKRYLNKTKQELPSLQHRVLAGSEIEERHVRAIIELNKARMQHKQKVSTYHDAQETEKTIRLAKLCGFIRIIELDSVIVAGEICSRVGNHYFSHVGAHDPAYDEYRLGIVNCYLTICECINRGGKQFHFLWGQYDYKYSLLGVQQDLNRVALYRSRLHICVNGVNALRLGSENLVRRMKSLINGQADQDRLSAKLLRKTLSLLQRTRPSVLAKALIGMIARQPGTSQTHQQRIYLNPVSIPPPIEKSGAKMVKSKSRENMAEACID